MVKPNKKKAYKSLTTKEKIKILHLHEEGKSLRSIGDNLGRKWTTIHYFLQKFQKTQKFERKKGSGRIACLTEKQDRNIILKVKRNPQLTLTEIKKDLGLKCSRMTICNRLRNRGFLSRYGLRKPLISKKNKTARLKWALKYRNKTQKFWDRVVFTDEKTFYVNFQGKIRYWSRKNQPKRMIGTVKHPLKINIWAGFHKSGKTDLVLIKGNLNSIQFKEILHTKFRPFKNKTFRKKRNKGVLQMDNDPKHKSKLVRKYLKRNQMNILEWPSQSPDLNPIENLWSEVERMTKDRCPTNTDDLFNIISNAWNQIKPETFKKLAQSMPKRIRAVIKSHGRPTKY